MTSVQNPRQPLSGSKWFLLSLFVLLIVGQSCHLIFPDRFPKPEPEPEPVDTVVVEPPDTIPEIDTMDVLFPEIHPDTINIAYLLPFFFDEGDTVRGIQKRLRDISLSFYQGSRLALDTLKDCGYKLNVHVFDSKNDTREIQRIKQKLIDHDIHLVFGPLFRGNTMFLSDFAIENKINFVSPLASVDECPVDNPYLFYSDPPVKSYGKAAAELANNEFAGITPVVLRRDDEEEARLADYFVEHLDFLVMDSLREIVYRRDDWQRGIINKKDQLGAMNFVFIPSRHEPFVSTMFTHLQSAEGEHFVAGLGRWQQFSRVDGVVWKRYNVHLLSAYFVNYKNPATIRFVEKYRDEYYTEPDEYAFRGFDETLVYANEIREKGIYFQRSYFPNPVMDAIPGLHKNYLFRDVEGCGAWLNQSIHTLLYRDHQLRPRGERR